MDGINRRRFISTTAGAAATAALGGAAKAVPPSEKIALGVIGVAGRGTTHLEWFGQHPDVQIAAVCDVYTAHRDLAAARTGATGYDDFRRLLDRKDIDAVTIATPPHWHPLIAIMACQAGKDVYCEKPMSRYPVEALTMAQAAEQHRRITQVGTQIHATANYHRCVDIVRSGALGQITAARNYCTMNDNSEGLGRPADTNPPPGLNWDFWLGPAPKVPFNPGRYFNGMHRYFKDYVDSWLHELGPHIVDLPVWALDLGQPLSVAAAGGRFATESIADVPDTLDVIWEYPEKTMTWSMMQDNSYNFGLGAPGPGRRLGTSFHGKKATLLANYDLCEVLGEDGKVIEGQTYPQSVPPSPGHEREFLDSIKTRRETSCSFRRDLPLHVALNLAHVALRLGRKLHWDAERFAVVGDGQANRYITPQYRAPWRLPAVRRSGSGPHWTIT